MADAIETIIDGVIAREGHAYTNNPADRGGPTKYGITQRSLAAWRDHAVTPYDVEHLTEPEARLIYHWNYVKLPGFGAIADAKLRGVVVDAGVNHGPRQATRMVQRAVGLESDGIFGPVTINALNALDPRKACVLVLADRIQFFGRMISKDLTDADKDGVPDNTEFAHGWLNRVAGLMREVA